MPHPRSNQSSPALRLLTHFLYCLDSRSPAVMGTGDSFLRFDPISNPTASLSLLYNEDNLEENQGNYSFLFFYFLWNEYPLWEERPVGRAVQPPFSERKEHHCREGIVLGCPLNSMHISLFVRLFPRRWGLLAVLPGPSPDSFRR